MILVLTRVAGRADTTGQSRTGRVSLTAASETGSYCPGMAADGAENGVVVFDIDGGLADMSASAAQLGPTPWSHAAWQTFFDHLLDAAVLENRRALVAATAALGFTVVYSTTRAAFTAPATRQWLVDHDFPAAAALFCRPNSDWTASALTVKRSHCHTVEQRLGEGGFLAAFVDDEPNVITGLRRQGFAGRRFTRLTDCTPANLNKALVLGPRTSTERPRSHRGRQPHRRAMLPLLAGASA